MTKGNGLATATVVVATLFLTAGSAIAGVSAAQKCQSGKDDTAGKYAACVLKAEKAFVLKGDAVRYDEALTKCLGKYSDKWQVLEAAAITAGSNCPSEGDVTSIQDFLDICAQNVADALGGGALPDCPGDLSTCTADLGTCNGDLTTSNANYASCSGSLTTCNSNFGTCSGNLGTCTGNLGTCTTNLGTCTGDLATCSGTLSTVNAGNAGLADVLGGKSFSSSAGIGVTGTMANNGAVMLTPGTADQTIAVGYHSGSGKCLGDADLATGNIRSGVNIFGVAGDPNVVNTSSGDAVAANMLVGIKAWVDGSEVTGNVPSGANVTGADGSLTSAIPDALYADGRTCTAADADLSSANIRSGVNVFGVAGDSNVVNTGSGDAVASNLLSGKKAWVDGSEITGNVPSGSNVSGSDGSLAITIPDALYAGSKTATASDADLSSGNVRSGVNIFGVSGNVNVVNTSSGDAVASNLLSGRKAWVDGSEITGNVPSGDNVTGSEGSLTSTIPDGIYAGSKTCSAADADLISTNIRGGVVLFGVTGDPGVVDSNSGDAVAEDLLSGKKAWVDGFEVTGNVPSGSNVTGGDGSLTSTIPDGLYAGSRTCTAADSDLAAGNIKFGVNLFGVLGTFSPEGPPVPGAVPVVTGQVTCFDGDGLSVDCAGTKMDGELQRGVARSFTNNGDGTVTDNATQLMWERLSDDGSIHDWDDTYTWTDSVAIKIATLNATNFAGHSDWRLPNQVELLTLVSLGDTNPATYSPFNTSCSPSCTVLTCTCVQAAPYWSSTSYLPDPAAAWIVHFADGGGGAPAKFDLSYVRAVRTAS